MNSIVVRSPTRVDLAGGTLDLWPLYLFVDNCWTVNVAVDLWTEVTIVPQNTAAIIIESSDLSVTWQFSDLDELLHADDAKLRLFQVCLNYLRPQTGFILKTSSQSPIGAGLGASSSLIISLLKAFAKWFSVTWDVYELVQIAHNLEAKVLHTPTGTQDYFPAIGGGISLLHYGPHGVKQEMLIEDLQHFSAHWFLVYSGRAHNSGLNNWEILKNAVAQDRTTLAVLAELSVIAQEMVGALKTREWAVLPVLFQREYQARLKLTAGFANDEIKMVDRVACSFGAKAVKICGAGGGGCVMVWCDSDNMQTVKSHCVQSGLKVLSANVV